MRGLVKFKVGNLMVVGKTKREPYSIFDPSIPDPPKIEPTTFWQEGSDGEMYEVINGGYDPKANWYKVRSDMWNHFSDQAKGTINHAFGGMLSRYGDEDSAYNDYMELLSMDQWREFAMQTLINSLWYWGAKRTDS